MLKTFEEFNWDKINPFKKVSIDALERMVKKNK